MKQHLLRLILANKPVAGIYYKLKNRAFPGSAEYWENRYIKNGTSGEGAYGKPSRYKADFLNAFVKENGIQSVIEFGSGDGNQSQLFTFPYFTGLDVSRKAIMKSKQAHRENKHRSFFLYDPYCFVDNQKIFSAELSLSLDVIYHLVEDEVYHLYMEHLFKAATRFVIIYAWDTDGQKEFHIRQRKFSNWINANRKDFELIKIHKNSSGEDLCCDFHIYKRI